MVDTHHMHKRGIIMSAPIPPPPPQLVKLMEQPFAPQRAFGYDPERWLKWLSHMPGAKSTLDMLPDKVARATIRQAFATLERDNIVGAFIAVMIWGYGYENLGPYRTARVLSDKFRDGNTLSQQVVEKLSNSCSIAREHGNVRGYSYLNNEGKMCRFGPSFFTKWLYYATATGPQGEEGAAPILDDKVIGWINDEAGEQLRYAKTPSYQRYIDVVMAWGAPYDLTAVDVEERIFRLIRNDGVDQPAQRPDTGQV